jgi:hypothetical protein
MLVGLLCVSVLSRRICRGSEVVSLPVAAFVCLVYVEAGEEATHNGRLPTCVKEDKF